MKHAIGLPASGLFTSRALARAVAACFESRALRGATLAGALALGAVASAQAATITVTNTNATGAGSLAWACGKAASNADSTDVITFAASVTGTIDLVGCSSTGDLTIRGPGAAKLRINGPYVYVFNYLDATIRLESLTLTNARLVARYDDHTTNGIDVRDCDIEDSRLSVGAAYIDNSKMRNVQIFGDTFMTNSSLANGRLMGQYAAIRDSVITGSGAGGIELVETYSFSSRGATIVNSVISGNVGAGIEATSPHFELNISSSVIANNGQDGIAFKNDWGYDPSDIYSDFSLTLNNSVISGNKGRSVAAVTGDFYFDRSAGDSVTPTGGSVVRMDNSTIVDNGGGVEVVLGNGGHLGPSLIQRTTIAGNGGNGAHGISVVMAPRATNAGGASSISLDSTLVAGNGTNADLYTDVPRFIFKANYSIIQNPAGAPITSTVAGSNITGQDPKLLRLANLGGKTSVRAFGAGSPALNKGNPSLTNVPATDQRGTGFPRVAGGRIDIGAFEQQAVDVAPVVLRSLPDVTGNGTPELAALVQSIPTGATTVRVRDALTGAAHWQVTLPGTGEAIDLETLGDVNGNGKRDIAVLRTAPASVAIRDGLTGAAVKTIALASGFFPKALATLVDVNGNGKPEVAVLGTKAGKSVVELRDSHTGALIKSTTFNSPGTPRDIVALRQQAGNASSAALLGVLMDVRDPTQSDSLEIRNALTGALVTRGDVGAGAESMEAVVLPDSNGNSGNEFAVLKSSGAVRVFDLPGFAPMTTMQFLAGETPLHLTTVPDTNGSGVTELAVLSRHQADGALKAEVRDAATGAIVSTMNYSSQYRADELVSVPDINNNGVAELSHVGPNSSGVVRATQRDVTTGVLSSRVNLVP